ncbi:hypothetical protein GCM10012288_18100 [Malaciobacter pacificus]|uniref:Thioredoxin n=1 Tax=Malaciobacter pacificus TaxID=1080223 RepID=A0A5C2HGD3_9BACT|nr:thioredoxin domain-containing protein [Malaciobacter pacificus]QEP35472.1 thioredoxin [Malaciobacter pacificus]GGD44164.1 hypothetical protein GCM10012288_18100 [Malaciobacter pacificus]
MKKVLILLLMTYVYSFAFEKLTVENFDSKIKGKNVIVDIYADWCPPCKIVAKNLEEFDIIKPDNVEIYKVDFDKQADIAFKYGVKSLPTLLFFKDGELVSSSVGVISPKRLLQKSKENF